MAYGYAHHNVKKCPGVFFKGGCDGRGRPVPGHVYCAKCERTMEERSKAEVKDADRRARLHRALDCVLDRKVAKDGIDQIEYQGFIIRSLEPEYEGTLGQKYGVFNSSGRHTLYVPSIAAGKKAIETWHRNLGKRYVGGSKRAV